MLDVVRRTADAVFIPLTVGGGVRTAEDVQVMLRAGADKVSLNSAAVARPEVIRESSEWFGAQAIVLSMDVLWNGAFYEIVTHGGRRKTGMDAVEWARRGVDLGAGEIVVNSIDADGTKDGYEIKLTRLISDAVTVPVVASGGAGNADHMADVLLEGRADAALAASIFHFGTIRIADVKHRLTERGLPMRPVPQTESIPA
jgi:cyclase